MLRYNILIIYFLCLLTFVGTTREILRCNMNTVVLNSELSQMSKPVIEVSRIIDELRNSQMSVCSSAMLELKEINCIAASRCNELVVVGSEHNIV